MGDYFGYFLITHAKGGLNANYEIVPYLGRVNLFALLPTFLFIFGIFYFFVIFKKFNINQKIIYTTFLLCISFMWIGYMWFVIKYPNYSKGGHYKSYVYFTANTVTSLFWIYICNSQPMKKRWIFNLLYSVFIFILIHNIPAMISRYLGGYT